jgi:hypothetical protein
MNKFKHMQIGEASSRRTQKIVERLITSYYDDLPVGAQLEESEWGDFCLSQLINETDQVSPV